MIDTRQNAKKTTPMKPAPQNGRQESKDQSWLHGFLFALGLIAVIAAAVIFYYTHNAVAAPEPDVYVSVQVRTLVGPDKMVVCKLSLVVDAAQENDIVSNKKLLEAVVSQSLVDTYQHTQRPELSEVRENLLQKINQKLPEDLQVREVLLQDLTVGYR